MEEAELDRRVRRIMTAWMAHWGELSPEHQATFLEAAEFRELALIPKEFGLKAINRFQLRKEILREAKRLQKERKTRTVSKRRRRPKGPKGLPPTSPFRPHPLPLPPPRRRWSR